LDWSGNIGLRLLSVLFSKYHFDSPRCKFRWS